MDFGSSEYLLTQKFLGGLDDIAFTKAEGFQNLCGGSGETELIVDTDAAHRGGIVLAEEAANSFAQTADDAMLLAGDDLTAFLGGLQHQFQIGRAHV